MWIKSILRMTKAIGLSVLVALAMVIAFASTVTGAQMTKPKLVDINAADIKTLQTLFGVDQALAQKIIGGRPYESLADLERVVGKKIIDSIKGLVTFGQPITAKAFLSDNVRGTEQPPGNIPTLEDVKAGQAQYIDRYYSAKEAAQLGIPIINLKGNRDYLVIVRDYKRWKPVKALDGTIYEYGQVIRAVIEVLSYDASITVDLASIAAQGTLNRRMQYFYLYKDGIYHPMIDKIIAEVSGKVFDVENYALYQKIMPEIINLFSDPSSVQRVNLIGVIPPEDDPNYFFAPIRTYALDQIAKGKTCAEAQKRFVSDTGKLAQIISTYQLILRGGDYSASPTQEQVEKAKKILGEIKIK